MEIKNIGEKIKKELFENSEFYFEKKGVIGKTGVEADIWTVLGKKSKDPKELIVAEHFFDGKYPKTAKDIVNDMLLPGLERMSNESRKFWELKYSFWKRLKFLFITKY